MSLSLPFPLHAFSLKPIAIICRPGRSGLIVSLSLFSPSVSLKHTGSVCAIKAVHRWQRHSYEHSFPLFCSSIATLYSCHSLGISPSLLSSPSVRVAHTSCLCTCPTAPYPSTHIHTLTHTITQSCTLANTRTSRQTGTARCGCTFMCHIK